jgi:hypothetical protein
MTYRERAARPKLGRRLAGSAPLLLCDWHAISKPDRAQIRRARRRLASFERNGDGFCFASVEAQARGLRYIDAPVTGLPEHAADGTLMLLDPRQDFPHPSRARSSSASEM